MPQSWRWPTFFQHSLGWTSKLQVSSWTILVTSVHKSSWIKFWGGASDRHIVPAWPDWICSRIHQLILVKSVRCFLVQTFSILVPSTAKLHFEELVCWLGFQNCMHGTSCHTHTIMQSNCWSNFLFNCMHWIWWTKKATSYDAIPFWLAFFHNATHDGLDSFSWLLMLKISPSGVRIFYNIQFYNKHATVLVGVLSTKVCTHHNCLLLQAFNDFWCAIVVWHGLPLHICLYLSIVYCSLDYSGWTIITIKDRNSKRQQAIAQAKKTDDEEQEDQMGVWCVDPRSTGEAFAN